MMSGKFNLIDVINLREAKLEDAETIYEILKVCGLDILQNQGSDHWWPPYPLKRVIEDIQSKDKKVYLITYNDLPVCTFMILLSPPSYYDSSIWGCNKNAIYPAKLAVLPEYRKYNIGFWCIQRYDKLAIERQSSFIRIDIYEKNENLINLYKLFGYRLKGISKTRRFNVICMEKEVK